MKRFLLIPFLCLSAFVLNAVCVVSTESNAVLANAEVMNVTPSIDSGIDGERPSPTDPGIDGDRPYQNEDPTEFPSLNPDIGYKPIEDNKSESGSNSNVWLYIVIGIGSIAFVSSLTLIVKTIKQKKRTL